MNIEQAIKLKKWLDDIGTDRVRNTEIIKVVFDNHSPKLSPTFFGVKYEWVGHYTYGMTAVQEGKHKDGEEYVETRLELLGERLPLMKQKDRFHESKVCYRLPHDDGDWYISCWHEKDDVSEYHPWGKQFQLGRWPHEQFGERIDHYSKQPRVRCLVDVEVIKENS